LFNALELDGKDLLQIDATIITGILILLTLSNLAGSTGAARNIAALVAVTILPFAVSATSILFINQPYFIEGLAGEGRRLITRRFGIYLTMFGFGLLVCIIMAFFCISYLHPDMFGISSHISSQNVTHPAKLAK
jgi:hypothetical protein